MRVLLVLLSRTLVALGLLVVFWGAQPAQAVTIVEIVTDAGDLPVTAQSSGDSAAFGTPLEAIVGFIVSDIDQDMYQIFIDDPAGFSATTDNALTDLDTMLYLFDENGLGVLAVDDGGTGGTSVIPAGSLTGPAGIYYLAVSIFDNTPVSFDGGDLLDIFDFSDLNGSDLPIAPSDPGGALPIASWDISADYEIGSYRIGSVGGFGSRPLQQRPKAGQAAVVSAPQ
jgi:hypothetical protein